MKDTPKIELKDIKTGDIGLTSGTTWLSRQIQNFQKLDNKDYNIYSHALIFRWEGDILYATEAQKRGICNNDYKKRYVNKKYKSLMVLKPKRLILDETSVINLMMPYIGNSKYNYFSLFFLQPVKMLSDKWLGRTKTMSKKFTCGRWCAFVYNRYFESTGQLIFPDEMEIAPVDLAESGQFDHYLIK